MRFASSKSVLNAVLAVCVGSFVAVKTGIASAQPPPADGASAAPAAKTKADGGSKPDIPKTKQETTKTGKREASGLEKDIDGAAKWVSDKLESVMFFEVIGRSSVKKTLQQPDKSSNTPERLSHFVEQIRTAIRQIEADGMNPHELDFKLTLPHGSLTSDQAQGLEKRLNTEFTSGRTRKFTVVVSESESQEASGLEFEAVRPGIPIVVLWLVVGAVFFTVRMGFINFRGFKHAIMVTAGKYDDPSHKGEVSHFQALTAALSATVGLGNIAGVAIAVMVGGPGATFWMILAGLLGMSSKFTECTLGQRYREIRPDGRIMGGAMFYLSKGLKEMKLGGLGAVLAVMFAVICVFASFGGGNAFQVNQSLRAVEETVPWLKDARWVYGLIMAAMVGVVIIGGIRRIAQTAEKIVPLMCSVYVLACLWILLTNMGSIPSAFRTIVTEAFTPQAGYGALLGVLVQGFRRAAFSNEAGVGSAAIAHSAARTEYPVREGIVALLEPFVDTVVVCTMTALVIVITGAYDNPDYRQFVDENNGAGLTSIAMKGEISWFPYVLSAAVVLFAYSTMISWSYYGERCWAWMFGDRSSMVYRVLFLIFVVLGSVTSATNVLNLSDLAILGMAFPNILGVVLLSGKVKRELNDYWAKYKAGELDQKQKEQR